MTTAETVVVLHGLYMSRLFMAPLGGRLGDAGYRVVYFSYPTLGRRPADNARMLAARVEALEAPVVHFVAHSLGGAVVRHLAACWPTLPPGRVVTLGTPHAGSRVAAALRQRGPGWLLGRSVDQGLLGDLPPWPAGRELGSLAGTLNVGVGRLLADLPEPADGTVAVAETCFPGMADHCCLPVTHTGLLVSPAVAGQVCAFLASGRFCHR